MTSRATSHEHSAPRLPSRSPDAVEAAFVAANAIPVSQLVEALDTLQRPAPAYENPVVFEAPELLPVRGVNIAWIAVRFAIFLWTAAIALVAFRTTNRIDGGASDRSIAAAGDDMTLVVVVGVVLLVVLLAASVLWSRTVAENTRRLRGRWPSLNRATRVWFYPTVWVALAALTFLRIDVTSEFNPLPAIAAIVFAISLYCPYSMLHRIFKTLTRERPDGAIRALYLLDLGGFGIIWWRLTDWPDPITSADAGLVDAMAWAAIAASGVLLISAGIAANLAHQVVVAQRYRIRVLATRHVQGLALPLVPRKAWGRVRTSIDDAAARGAGPVGDVVRAAELVVGPGGAPSAAVVAAAKRTVVAGRGSDVAAARTASPTAERPAAGTSIPPGDRPVPVPTPATDSPEVPTRRTPARAGDAPVTRRRPVPGAAGQVTRRRATPAGDGGDLAARRRSSAARRQPGAGQPPGAPTRRRAGVPGAAGAAVARRRAAGVTAEVAARRALAAQLAASRRQSQSQSQAGDESELSDAGPPPSPEVGGLAPSARSEVVNAEAEGVGVGHQPPRQVPVVLRVDDADEPPEPTTFVGVLRFLALGAHVVLAATFVWFVVEARNASGGLLDRSHVDRLDLVRTANVVALVATVLLIGAWGTATSMLARQSQRAAPSPWLVGAMCVPATLLALFGLVIDGRVGEGIVFTMAVLAAGFGGACSLALLSTMEREADDGSHGLEIWAAVIAVVGLGLTIGGYLQSIEADGSLDTLTLVAILTSILVGLAVLLGAPASAEHDDVAQETRLVGANHGNEH